MVRRQERTIMTEIPEMSHPLGQHWRQPKREDLLVDDMNAIMGESDLESLAEYSQSIPTGVYPGKMWKANYGRDLLLRWYGPIEADGMCTIFSRIILVI